MSESKSPKPEELHFAVLAADAVCFRIIDNQLHVLLGKVKENTGYGGMWAFIGGLVNPTENAHDSVKRHLREKAGIDKIFREQLYTFSDVNRDKRGRVVSVAYLALAGDDVQDSSKAKIETKWHPISTLPKLAYDHDEIFKKAFERLKGKITYSNIAQHLLPPTFTFSEMQKVYELVLERKLDKRNFRKKIISMGMVKETGETRREGVMRPASLYKFTSEKLMVYDTM